MRKGERRKRLKEGGKEKGGTEREGGKKRREGGKEVRGREGED